MTDAAYRASKAKFPAGEVRKAAMATMKEIEADREEAKAEVIEKRRTYARWAWHWRRFQLPGLEWATRSPEEAHAVAEKTLAWKMAVEKFEWQYVACQALEAMASALHPGAGIEMTALDFRLIANGYPDHAAHKPLPAAEKNHD